MSLSPRIGYPMCDKCKRIRCFRPVQSFILSNDTGNWRKYPVFCTQTSVMAGLPSLLWFPINSFFGSLPLSAIGKSKRKWLISSSLYQFIYFCRSSFIQSINQNSRSNLVQLMAVADFLLFMIHRIQYSLLIFPLWFRQCHQYRMSALIAVWEQ